METNSTEEQRLLRVDGNYGVDQIKALEGLEAVRKRPGMYIGSTSQTGIDQTVYEVVDNSFDEYIAGYGKDITITVGKDASISVSDQGRGIPVGDHHEWVNPDGTPMNTLTGILTKLHAGGKFGGDTGYKCFPSETPVRTTTGDQPIAIIKPGAVVVDGYGREREVTDVFTYDHAGELVAITTEDGRRLRAVDGHYVLVHRVDQLLWVDVKSIVTTDQLVELEPGDDLAELERIIPRYDVVKYRGSAE